VLDIFRVLFPASEKGIRRSKRHDGKSTKDAMASLDDDEVEDDAMTKDMIQ
jgi:hypothetical protein